MFFSCLIYVILKVLNSSCCTNFRYVLQFHKETPAELKERKKQAYETIETVTESDLEHNLDDYFLPELDFPKRPEWNFNMSLDQLDRREQEYFREYLVNIEKR